MIRLWRSAGLAARLTGWYIAVLALMLALLATFLYAALARALEQNTFAQLRGDARDVRWAFERAVMSGTPPTLAADRALADATTPGVGVVLVGADGDVLASSKRPRERPVALPLPAAAALRDGLAEWSGIVEDADAPGQIAVVVVRTIDRPPLALVRAAEPGKRVLPPTGAAAWPGERVPAPEPPPGRTLVVPEPPPGTLARPEPPPPWTLPRPGPPTTWTRPVPADLVDHFELATAPSELGIVQISVSLSPVQATLRTMRALLVGGVLATLALAALAGLPLTRIGLRPLRAVAGASRRLAEGDLAARVPPTASQDEIGELARAFNHMAERLEASFAAQRAFVADASHELRTPLTALGGQLDVLLRAAGEDPEEAERLARAMRREVSRTNRLVEDLLVLARLDAQGARALRVARVDLVAIARDVFEEVRALPAARGRSVWLDQRGPVPVLGDASRLHQALLNLAVNALQHGDPTGAVVLRVEAEGRLARATVEDDGPGIPPEHLARLFDRFYRVEAARTRPADGGAGIGLAIARAIVEAHGGAIAAANRAGGARFTIELALDDSQPILNPTTEAPKVELPG
jgi:signal transduction histidine kinase